MKSNRISLLTVALCIAGTSLTQATNITLDDGRPGQGFGSGAPNGRGVGNEDQETEPGTVANQSWDVEAFVMKGSKLTLIGGFDFLRGVDGFRSGDLFVDTDGDFVYGSHPAIAPGDGYKAVSNGYYRYEYALDLDLAQGEFRVYPLDHSTVLSTGYYRQNDKTSPFELWPNQNISPVFEGTLVYETLLSDTQVVSQFGADVVLQGGTHNALTLDLSPWLQAHEVSLYFTMACGNDGIIGRSAVPETGLTLTLLGLSCVALGGYARGKRARSV